MDQHTSQCITVDDAGTPQKLRTPTNPVGSSSAGVSTAATPNDGSGGGADVKRQLTFHGSLASSRSNSRCKTTLNAYVFARRRVPREHLHPSPFL